MTVSLPPRYRAWADDVVEAVAEVAASDEFILKSRVGDLESAERHLRNALETAAGSGLDMERAEVLREAAELRLAQGRGGEAREALREAVRLFRDLGMEVDAGTVQARLAALEAAPM